MNIIVNPHNQQEEFKLLAFLDSMHYDYIRDDNTFILSDAQQQEILERDKLYEAGEMKSFSLEEIVTHFNLQGK